MIDTKTDNGIKRGDINDNQSISSTKKMGSTKESSFIVDETTNTGKEIFSLFPKIMKNTWFMRF